MIDVRQRLPLPSGASDTYYSLPHLENRGGAFFVLTPIEAAYLSAGGIMRYVLEQLDSSLRDGTLKSAEEQRPQ